MNIKSTIATLSAVAALALPAAAQAASPGDLCRVAAGNPSGAPVFVASGPATGQVLYWLNEGTTSVSRTTARW